MVMMIFFFSQIIFAKLFHELLEVVAAAETQGGVSSVPVTAICFTIFTFEQRSNKVSSILSLEFGSQTEFQRPKEEAVCHLRHLLLVIFSSSISSCMSSSSMNWIG